VFNTVNVGSGSGGFVTQMTIEWDNMNINTEIVINLARQNRFVIKENDLSHGLGPMPSDVNTKFRLAFFEIRLQSVRKQRVADNRSHWLSKHNSIIVVSERMDEKRIINVWRIRELVGRTRTKDVRIWGGGGWNIKTQTGKLKILTYRSENSGHEEIKEDIGSGVTLLGAAINWIRLCRVLN
jgi:hypothetical protein